jgi:hypothetical protein
LFYRKTDSGIVSLNKKKVPHWGLIHQQLSIKFEERIKAHRDHRHPQKKDIFFFYDKGIQVALYLCTLAMQKPIS